MSDCLRCGNCCISLAVVIVDDPDLGIAKDNLIFHDGNSRCKHLRGDAPGEYCCAIHDMPWYPETPCASYNSEYLNGKPCPLGEYIIKRYQESLKKS